MNLDKTASREWSFSLQAEFGHRDITSEIVDLVSASGVSTGIVAIGLVGSTGGITTIEYEAGALSDLETALERIAPRHGEYVHNERWGDGNGFSHVRSAMLGTGITIPVISGAPALGTWQQVVVINLDNRPRERRVVGVVSGA